MSEQEESISHRRVRTARLLLVVLFFVMCAGDAAFWLFSVHRSNPLPAMQGLVVGSLLGTTALLVALWRRSTWARYILMLVNWLIIVAFSVPGLILLGGDAGASRRPLIPLFSGMLAYVIVNVALMNSRRLHRLGTPRGCGE